MNRCVVIHRTGMSEVQDVQPVVHQKLRGLEYRRFVVELTRDVDGRVKTGAVYSQAAPSGWQVGDAAKKLWGRGSGSIRVFDDDGLLLLTARDEPRSGRGAPTPALGSTVIPTAMPSPPRPAAPTIGHRVLVGSNDPATVELLSGETDLPRMRLTAVPDRGWVVEVQAPSRHGDGAWQVVHVVPPMAKAGGTS